MTYTVKYAVVKDNKHSSLAIGTPAHMNCTYQYNGDYAKKFFSFGEIDPAELDGKRCGLCNDDWRPSPKLLVPLGHAVSCGCLNCGSKPEFAPMEMVIAVGFGSAYVSKDGVEVLDGEASYHDHHPQVTVADAEKLYLADPDHDWRIVLDGPMGGVVYQRHEQGWVACIRLPGFA